MGRFGTWMADHIADFVGSWRFVIIYTTAMGAWVTLHVTGVLHIDSPDFMRWNLWLSYFAGIQASILLMASNRELERDRARARKTLTLTEASLRRISELTKCIDALEDQLSEMQEAEND